MHCLPEINNKNEAGSRDWSAWRAALYQTNFVVTIDLSA
jgi:hypothetical protein